MNSTILQQASIRVHHLITRILLLGQHLNCLFNCSPSCFVTQVTFFSTYLKSSSCSSRRFVDVVVRCDAAMVSNLRKLESCHASNNPSGVQSLIMVKVIRRGKHIAWRRCDADNHHGGFSCFVFIASRYSAGYISPGSRSIVRAVAGSLGDRPRPSWYRLLPSRSQSLLRWLRRSLETADPWNRWRAP